jgi:hypothetical protein
MALRRIAPAFFYFAGFSPPCTCPFRRIMLRRNVAVGPTRDKERDMNPYIEEYYRLMGSDLLKVSTEVLANTRDVILIGVFLAAFVFACNALGRTTTEPTDKNDDD